MSGVSSWTRGRAATKNVEPGQERTAATIRATKRRAGRAFSDDEAATTAASVGSSSNGDGDGEEKQSWATTGVGEAQSGMLYGDGDVGAHGGRVRWGPGTRTRGAAGRRRLAQRGGCAMGCVTQCNA